MLQLSKCEMNLPMVSNHVTKTFNLKNTVIGLRITLVFHSCDYSARSFSALSWLARLVPWSTTVKTGATK